MAIQGKKAADLPKIGKQVAVGTKVKLGGSLGLDGFQ